VYNFFIKVYSIKLKKRQKNGPAGRRSTAMPLIIEAIYISLTMLIAFLSAFAMMFLLALFLSPIERGISKIIWDHAASRRPATPGQKAPAYRDFSKKHL
jgi:uncharacterized RDD family membrane protein YckC